MSLAEEILKLKKEPGKDMIVFGSSVLAVDLIQHGLIDEFRIMVNPVILGSGHSIFKSLLVRHLLKLLDLISKMVRIGRTPKWSVTHGLER